MGNSVEMYKGLFIFLMNECPSKVLIFLLNPNKKSYMSGIARNLNITYSWLIKILQVLYKAEMISNKKVGRRKYIILTEKGKLIAEQLNNVRKLCL